MATKPETKPAAPDPLNVMRLCRRHLDKLEPAWRKWVLDGLGRIHANNGEMTPETLAGQDATEK